jgi:hypothetical protein
MQSMAQCFPVYGAAAVGERSKELWEGIKTEVSATSTRISGSLTRPDYVFVRCDNRSCRLIRIGEPAQDNVSHESEYSIGTGAGYHQGMPGDPARGESDITCCNKGAGSSNTCIAYVHGHLLDSPN